MSTERSEEMPTVGTTMIKRKRGRPRKDSLPVPGGNVSFGQPHIGQPHTEESSPSQRTSTLTAPVVFAESPQSSVGKSHTSPVGVKDNLDIKLDHFQYTLDPEEAAVWEHDETISPLHVPKHIRDKYPQFDWHYVSEYKIRTRGLGYNGWQLFKDSTYPEGIKRGNDLFLAAMPKKMAESYRRRVSERSTEAVRNVQYRGIARMEQALGELHDPDAGILQPGETVAGREVHGAGRVVRRARVGIGGNYPTREEIHERIAKGIEERNKKKVYSFLGQK